MNDLGPVLRRAREAAGITQQQVADHLGKTRPYVSRVEAGINTTTDALFAWADFLGLQVKVERAAFNYLSGEVGAVGPRTPTSSASSSRHSLSSPHGREAGSRRS